MAVGEENVALVRGMYDAWLRGESARRWIAADLEYVNPPDAVEAGTVRGRRRLGAWRDAYDLFRIEPERIEAVGPEDVVVVAKVTIRGRGSQAEVVTEQGYVWTIRDGQAVRFRWFRDPAEALDEVGLRT
jgi:ketosteroid isomerase-like protein